MPRKSRASAPAPLHVAFPVPRLYTNRLYRTFFVVVGALQLVQHGLNLYDYATGAAPEVGTLGVVFSVVFTLVSLLLIAIGTLGPRLHQTWSLDLDAARGLTWERGFARALHVPSAEIARLSVKLDKLTVETQAGRRDEVPLGALASGQRRAVEAWVAAYPSMGGRSRSKATGAR